MNVKKQYLCPACESVHESDFMAQRCCSPIEIYRCGKCGTRFERYEDEKAKAEACCKDIAPQIARNYFEFGDRCLCGAVPTFEDVRDSKLIGSLLRCRACILKVAPEVVAA